MRGGVRHRQSLQSRLRPVRQCGRLGLSEGNVFRSAETAARGDRSARTTRYHHGRDRMVEVEVAARHAVDVGHGYLFDSCQIVIGRLQSVQRDRVGPDLG